jgi:hypothetical protein
MKPMAKLKSMKDRKFGSLVVLHWSKIKHGWKCLCECGNHTYASKWKLENGIRFSCGCRPPRTYNGGAFVHEKIIGKTHGKLLVVCPAVHDNHLFFCKCECGGWIKASDYRIMSGQVYQCKKCAKKDRVYKERTYTKDGYCLLWAPKHPRAANRGRVFEHIIVMEDCIGRYLYPKETVHHKNGIRDDNNIKNLELWVSNHPSGQRVQDKIEHAIEIIARYGDEYDVCKLEQEP